MKRTLANIILIIAFILVTFFGIGPVLMADGSTKERMATLAVVIILYVVIIILAIFVRKKFKKD